jgi:uncharacterized oxidoreductase
MYSSGNTILITGGGSGIGRALAQRFQALGNHVIVAGRRADALTETIAGRETMTAVTLDITDADAITAFARAVVRDHPPLNILINNAGIMYEEDIAIGRDLAATEAMIATNLLGPIRLTNALLDHLGDQAGAAIVNVTSGLAFVPMARTATYCATKAALHSYTLSLRLRLKDKVEVIELAPPGVQTNLTPGQATRPGFLPLDAFADQAMALLQQQPTPPEILVEAVRLLRHAEANGQFDATLAIINVPRW